MTFVPATIKTRREKVFGAALGIPLDRNAKVRIMHAAKAYNARYRQEGQHKGPLTRAIMEVLETLLWSFHNSRSGLCFPSYEAIAAKAGCNRDTVYRATHALEAAGIVTLRLIMKMHSERFQDLTRCAVFDKLRLNMKICLDRCT